MYVYLRKHVCTPKCAFMSKLCLLKKSYEIKIPFLPLHLRQHNKWFFWNPARCARNLTINFLKARHSLRQILPQHIAIQFQGIACNKSFYFAEYLNTPARKTICFAPRLARGNWGAPVNYAWLLPANQSSSCDVMDIFG